MDPTTVNQLAQRIFELLGERLGARGSTLEKRVRHAGRLLPRRVRQAAKTLVDAEKMAQNQTLAMRLDPQQISGAYDRCIDYLDNIDPAARRSQARFNMAATLAFQVLAVGLLLAIVLRWRGYL
ncbi:hypothetical protein [Litoreibacter roseus]|uniref:Uncharacterized protein n=1 Tax=Litoreibacter roseus TaxID=2601869 RepID=A0A6N6JBW0_9RHOB|nr:hypothetical protein [Litoreibacter roseus]GFE63487.1 hypothetical protein KIN_05610 [Litoreibacter roseus]